METKDVDLEALLAEPQEAVDPAGASAEKVTEDSPSDGGTPPNDAISLRAQERIRELVEENKKLKDANDTRSNSDVDAFLNSIEDEPSRNLLKQYSALMEQKLQKSINPVVVDYQTARFEKEFSQFAAVSPDLAEHKEDIRKDFLRNPSQSLKGMVGERLMDIQSSKIKPLETATPTVNRSGTPSLDTLDKDSLYDILENQRPPIH